MGLPAVIFGGPDPAGQFPAAWVDESASMNGVIRYLAALGHQRIARVAVVYDSDILAIAGLAVTREIGLPVPLTHPTGQHQEFAPAG